MTAVIVQGRYANGLGQEHAEFIGREDNIYTLRKGSPLTDSTCAPQFCATGAPARAGGWSTARVGGVCWPPTTTPTRCVSCRYIIYYIYTI